jgi:LPS export ABC transporter protein LptC
MPGSAKENMTSRHDGQQAKVHSSCSIDRRLWAVVCSLLSIVCCSSCENSEEAIQEWTGSKVLVEEAHNINTLFSQGGRMRARLTAPLMLRYTTDTVYVEFPKSLHVDFYDSTGKKESELDALYGKYFETTNRVYLRDSVVVANILGDTLRSPDLWWNQATGKFYTDKIVRIKTSDKQVNGGRGLEADQDLSNTIIFEPKGVIAAPPGM